MRTREELVSMSVLQLNKIAEGLFIKHFGKMDKCTLIGAILQAQIQPTNQVLFTDRHDRPISEGQFAYFRIGATWWMGVIDRLKVIEEDQVAFATLETGKAKMFYTMDVDSQEIKTKSI